MSLDPSLRTSGMLAGVRSVLKRSERIERMKTDKKFDSAKNTPIGLPKTRVSKK